MKNHLEAGPSIEDIVRAQHVLKEVIHRTPLEHSTTFSRLAGSKVYLKLENLQKTGSFKIRGAYTKLHFLPEAERRKGVVAASAGNHAQGVAFAASLMKIPCTIVMPDHASPSKVSATRHYGAKILLHGSVFDEALTKAEEIATITGATLIQAFDDPQVIAGQGTVGLEILEDLPSVGSIYVPVGGGGLLAGVAVAVKSKNPAVKVVGVQSKAFPAMHASMREGRVVEAVRGATIADGIAVKKPGGITFKVCKNLVDEVVLVDDEEIVEAMFLLMERAKLIVEPAGAAALAYLLTARPVKQNAPAAVVLSGGNVDMPLLRQIVGRGLVEAGRMITLSFNIVDRPGALKSIVDRMAEARANIVEVEHDRLDPEVQAGRAKVTFRLEAEDKSHRDKVLRALRRSGLKFRVVR